MRKRPIVEIEDVVEPFCGVRRKNLVPLIDAAPEVAEEWCYKKNCGFTPADFSHGSGVRVWWRCPYCTRDYKAQINNRTGNHTGCPFCASKRICEENALLELFPEVAKEFHPKKNKNLKVSDVMHGSNRRIWWLCSLCSHDWQAYPSSRTAKGSGCPKCYEAAMQYAREHPPERKRNPPVLNSKDENISRTWYEQGRHKFKPLSRSNPKIAKQWHPTKNGSWTPADFGKGSEAVAWWRCSKGADHEWQASIYSRTGNRGRNCPFCIGKRVSKTNSLATLFPKVAKQWHPSQNGKLTPHKVTAHSNVKVWWQCQTILDHVWKTSINLRSRGSQCPFCSHFKTTKETSIKTQYPDVAGQLHPTKNKDLNPYELAPNSGRKVWWICSAGSDHEWEATPANRVNRRSGCPFCAGKKASKTNSLAALYPKIAKEWHKTKNGSLKPQDLTAGSGKIVWWKCPRGHNYEQSVNKRTSRNDDCGKCRFGSKKKHQDQ